MSLFNEKRQGPTADRIASQFVRSANQTFNQQLQDVYSSVKRCWFQNQVDGKPSAEVNPDDPKPTGPEILTAMGTDAQAVMTVAGLRLQMLLNVQQTLGQDIVDLSRCLPPYDLTFKADGSLDEATLKKPE